MLILLHACCTGEALPSPPSTVRRQLRMDEVETPAAASAAAAAMVQNEQARPAENEADKKGISEDEKRMIQMMLEDDPQSDIIQLMLARAKQKFSFVKASVQLTLHACSFAWKSVNHVWVCRIRRRRVQCQAVRRTVVYVRVGCFMAFACLERLQELQKIPSEDRLSQEAQLCVGFV